MRYLLDTNVLSEVIRKQPNRGLLQRLSEVAVRDVVTSAVCVAELRYGAARVAHGARLWERIAREILSRIDILPLGEAEAVRAGDLLAILEAHGEPIGVEDVWIGATALEHRLTVVTRNLKHFRRIPGLASESWWVTSEV
ncbi:MAG: tRNA(fMet)-specific endonuclease VapC [Thermoanaerobaculia bacterium]|nr:tRNA(fMet)-specific endonuclease VapC [Thermoanaerobaculia bacterium]